MPNQSKVMTEKNGKIRSKWTNRRWCKNIRKIGKIFNFPNTLS